MPDTLRDVVAPACTSDDVSGFMQISFLAQVGEARHRNGKTDESCAGVTSIDDSFDEKKSPVALNALSN